MPTRWVTRAAVIGEQNLSVWCPVTMPRSGFLPRALVADRDRGRLIPSRRGGGPFEGEVGVAVMDGDRAEVTARQVPPPTLAAAVTAAATAGGGETDHAPALEADLETPVETESAHEAGPVIDMRE